MKMNVFSQARHAAGAQGPGCGYKRAFEHSPWEGVVNYARAVELTLLTHTASQKLSASKAAHAAIDQSTTS